MNNPTILTIFSLVFILLGAYNLYSASKQAREMRLAGQKFKWTKQIKALVGIEYLLLAWVFLLSNLYSNSTLSSSAKTIVLPLYLLCLVAAALFAGLVIYRGIFNARTIRAQQAASKTSMANGNRNARLIQTRSVKDDSDHSDRKRARRKNAAAARRRRAGKA